MLGNGFQYYFLLINGAFGNFRMSTKCGTSDPFIYCRNTCKNTRNPSHFNNYDFMIFKIMELESFEMFGKGGCRKIATANVGDVGK